MKKLKGILLILLLAFGCLGFSRNVHAETIIKEGKTVIYGIDDDKTLFSFRHDGYSVYHISFEIRLKDSSDMSYASNDDLLFSLDDSSFYSCVETRAGISGSGYIYAGGEREEDLEINEKYAVNVYNFSHCAYIINYKVFEYQGLADNIKLPSQINLKLNTTKTIKPNSIFPYGSYPVIEWKSQNKSIAEVDEMGNVWGKKVGVTYIIATLDNGYQSKCKVTVTGRPPQMNYKKFTMVTQTTLKAELLYADGNIKWSSSNPKVATVNSKGTITAKGIGECTITARYKKVNYTAKVIVKREYPNYYARLINYNTRDNYFVVNFKNKSGKPITIYPSSAKVEHVAYRAYDRYLRLSGGMAITIPAGKSRNVNFYVQGGLTWYDYGRYTLFYQMGFDGGKYEAHVWDSNSVFKRGGKWYHTERTN